MKYKIEYAKVYGKDTAYKPETAITQGKSFSRSKALEKVRIMRRYSNSVHYKIVRNK